MEELLQQILTELRIQNAPKLGFSNTAPGAMWVFCNRKNPPHLWYTVQDGEVVALPGTSLTAYFQSIAFPSVERKNKEVTKLNIYMAGDRPYVIESGYDSHFSKGLLSAIATLTADQLRYTPLTICPQPGDDEAVLFCRVYLGQTLVKSQYAEDTDWRAIAHRVVTIAKELAA